jgi:anti-sigma regulatory factor (Ser/Thr protein kinase)
MSEYLELTAQPHNLGIIHDALDRIEAAVEKRGTPTPGVYDAFRTAVIEVATNILRHAYPPGAPSASMTLQLYLFPQRLEAIFQDQGIAFALPQEVSSPALDELEDILSAPEGNFGLFLAINALDHMDYSRSPTGVNKWHLIKRLPMVSS